MGLFFDLTHTSLALLSTYLLALSFETGFFNFDSQLKTRGFKEHNCKAIKNLVNGGCEDQTVLSDGSVFLACDPKRYFDLKPFGNLTQQVIDDVKQPSKMYLVDPNKPAQAQQVTMKNFLDKVPDARFHGLDVYHRSDGKDFVYLVNHRRDGDAVEVFEVDSKTKSATYVASYQHPLFRLTNEVSVVPKVDDKKQAPGFYITNFVYNRNDTNKLVLELLSFRPWGNLLYCEPKDSKHFTDKATRRLEAVDCKVVASKMLMANGVKVSKDGGAVYTATVSKGLEVYERNKKTNTLKFYKSYPAPIRGVMDNVAIDSKTGDVFTVVHPKVRKYFAHHRNHEVPSPSQILRFKNVTPNKAVVIGKTPLDFEVQEFLLSDGTEYSCGSGCTKSGDFLVCGTVFDKTYMVCQVN